MKTIKILFWAVVSTAFLLCGCTLYGCTSENDVYLENASDTVTEQEGVETQAEQAESSEAASDTKQEAVEKTEGICYIHLCGAVKNPGIYILPEGSRIYEAVLMAGGLTEDACEESVNQAEVLTDGQLIKILTKEEAVAADNSVVDGSKEAAETVSDGRINLNTATVSELTTLPGVGESKAEAIIAYREEHDGFSSIEEIMNIAGIKDGIFQRIKEKIKVE